MANYEKIYPEHALVPVIHYLETSQAVEMAGLVIREIGARAILLINDDPETNDPNKLLDASVLIRKEAPLVWQGINFNDVLKPAEALELAEENGLDGLW